MEERLLHVFRNTPLGRETFLQSSYFCKTLGIGLHVYIPQTTQFIMYFDHDAVQVDLDGSYLHNPDQARETAERIAGENGIKPAFFEPKNFTASQLPDITTAFNYMTCPRTISDLSSKIGLGYIGPKVRRIINASSFPVLMPSAVFKAWKSITVFYGGSINANRSLRWGFRMAEISGLDLDMITFTGKHPISYFEERLSSAGLMDKVHSEVRHWSQIKGEDTAAQLVEIPHDAILVIGAYGHGLIKELLFGSKMETVQSWMPNTMLLVGPNNTLGS